MIQVRQPSPTRIIIAGSDDHDAMSAGFKFASPHDHGIPPAGHYTQATPVTRDWHLTVPHVETWALAGRRRSEPESKDSDGTPGPGSGCRASWHH